MNPLNLLGKSVFTSENDKRRRFHLKHQYALTPLRQMCIAVVGVKLWNSLQADLSIFQLKINAQ